MFGVVSRELPWLADPEALVRLLAQHPAWCWLDGAASARDGDDVAAQCSYFAVAARVESAERGGEDEFLRRLQAPLAVGLKRSQRLGAGSETVSRSGFRGGWVTALSYEFGVAVMGCEPAADDADPAFALWVTEVLELDHHSGRATLYAQSGVALDRWWQSFQGAWAGPGAGGAAPRQARGASQATLLAAGSDGSTVTGTGVAPEPGSFNWSVDEAEYQQQVLQCQRSISAGDAYVLCLTDQARATAVLPPLDLYLRLRGSRPGIRGGVLVAGGRALLSASPERFLSVREGVIRTHPIKGTRPRGGSPEADREFACELAADPKERSENLMIVDLMRNDLTRVCLPGSVATEGFLRVESHPHVHQLVSTVSGELRDGVGLEDVLLACFPGGSMTGAPKQRAIEILAGLEAQPRGLYSGCFGWISADAESSLQLELAMTIRSIELRGNRALVGAGGGITADSVPEQEHAERILKADPLRAALHP